MFFAYCRIVATDIHFIACMRYRRGRPVKASRYALRASRSVVVSLSLSRRNAASESEKKAVARGSWLVARKTMPHGLVMYITIYSRRAAQGSLYRGADRQRRSERLKIGPYNPQGTLVG